MLIDSHCHLDFPDFATDGLNTVLDRARAAGVHRFLTISTRLTTVDKLFAIAGALQDVHWNDVEPTYKRQLLEQLAQAGGAD